MYEQDKSKENRTHLKKGDIASINLEANKWSSDVVHVASVGMGIGESGKQDRLEIFDLRQAPLHKGRRNFNGVLFFDDVDFLAISPEEFDVKSGTGFKAIRPGVPVTFGREHHGDRFKHFQDATSRSHVKIEFDKDTNNLIFADMSLNGTDITSDFTVSGMVETYDESESDPQTIARSWLNSHHEAPTDDIVNFISLKEAQNQADEWLTNTNTPEATHDIVSVEGYRPTGGIEIKGKRLLVSDTIYDDKGRAHIIGYSTDKYDRVVPRLFYKSNSDGGWRITPCIHREGVYDKGDIWVADHNGNYIEYGQYVQTTKPTETIMAFLEKRERSGVVSQAMLEDRFFSEDKYDESDISTSIREEVKVRCVFGDDGSRLDAYASGRGFTIDRSEAIKKLEAMTLPEGFEPNFNNGHTREYTLDHTILGKARVRVFKSRLEGKTVEWHVANDVATGIVWLDRIVAESSSATSFGTQSEIILAGALSAKPVDYVSQSRNLLPGEDYNNLPYSRAYVSVKPTLDRMPWVKRFRAAYHQ